MNAKDRASQKNWEHSQVPQMQVRSDVRSGSDLDTCKFNLNKWRERYYYWYNQAKLQGKV